MQKTLTTSEEPFDFKLSKVGPKNIASSSGCEMTSIAFLTPSLFVFFFVVVVEKNRLFFSNPPVSSLFANRLIAKYEEMERLASERRETETTTDVVVVVVVVVVDIVVGARFLVLFSFAFSSKNVCRQKANDK